MTESPLQAEITRLVASWQKAQLEKDLAAAAELRAHGYTLTIPSGEVMVRADELAMLASPEHVVYVATVENLVVEGKSDVATATFDSLVEGEFAGQPRSQGQYRLSITFRRSDGVWRAQSCRVSMPGATAPQQPGRSFRRGLRNLLGRVMPRPVHRAQTFQELAYLPYRPGLDFLLPPAPPPDPSGNLPIPPPELWLGFNYPTHGKLHTDTMLRLVEESGFSLRDGDRILDHGCGAGRMIRHLQPLAATCEIWGTDISAEHIFWCRQHLSPPFHFATTTKVPHLPFEDRSFRLIYCGSLFTHIDDMADAWLLELHRILAPDGRLYITIHDHHTIDHFDHGPARNTPTARHVTAHPIYQEAKTGFGMFTVGRDENSQVFYDLDFFKRMVRSTFEVLSVTTEAYFYQTALVLKRKER